MAKRFFLGTMFGLLVMLGQLAPALGATPANCIKETTSKILRILADPALLAPDKAGQRRKEIRQAIDERFDWEEMSRRSLGLHWRKRTPQERKAFTTMFARLLEGAYMEKVVNYSGEKVTYEDEHIDGDYGSVSAKIFTKKKGAIRVEYRLMKKGDEWLVYDVSIEGVSLVNNYRTQFNNILRNASFEELMEKLKEKVSGK